PHRRPSFSSRPDREPEGVLQPVRALHEMRGEVPSDPAPGTVPRMQRQLDAYRSREFREEVPRDLEANQPAVRGIELPPATDRLDRRSDHVALHERPNAGPEARRLLLGRRDARLLAPDLECRRSREECPEGEGADDEEG